jgi:hypothetical protein
MSHWGASAPFFSIYFREVPCIIKTAKKDYSVLSKAASSHRTYVEKILRYYEENSITPGDPKVGVWNQAHYPQPSCLGGQTVVLLLREHHAVQGVLQSEEYQHPCVWGWEREYLDDDQTAIYLKWKRVQGEIGRQALLEANARMTPEARRERAYKAAKAPRKLRKVVELRRVDTYEIVMVGSLKKVDEFLDLTVGSVQSCCLGRMATLKRKTYFARYV